MRMLNMLFTVVIVTGAIRDGWEVFDDLPILESLMSYGKLSLHIVRTPIDQKDDDLSQESGMRQKSEDTVQIDHQTHSQTDRPQKYLPFILDGNKLKIDNIKQGGVDIIFLSKLMPNLETLEIVGNGKELKLATGFSVMNSKIKHLRISNCELSRNDIKKILNLKNLEIVDLSGISMSRIHADCCFINSKSTLRLLNLNECSLEVDFVKKLAEFEKLEELDLTGSNLSKLDNSFDFGSLKNTLKRLNLENCDLKPKVLQQITKFDHLEELNLRNNDLSAFNGDLGSLKSTVKKLDLEGCKVNHKTFEKLKEFERLDELNLNHTKLTTFNVDFGNLKKTLKKLNLKWCEVNPKIVEQLAGFESLEELNLADNNLSSFSGDFGNLKSTMKKLDLEGCKVNRATVEQLTQFERLEELNLSMNLDLSFICTDDRFDFGKLKDTVKEMNLRENKLNSSAIFKKLSGFTKLEDLNLRSNDNLSLNGLENDSDFEHLRKTVKKLNLACCSMKTADLEKLVKAFTCLEELDLWRNNFSGLTPDFDFGNWKHTMKKLDLCECKLDDNHAILKKITEFTKLERLGIAYNDMYSLDADFDFGNLKDTLKVLGITFCHFKKKIIQKLRRSSRYQIMIYDN